MDFFDALHVSSSGLTAQRLRMNLISSNLANVNTTRTPEGGPFRRKEVVFEAVPLKSEFNEMLKDRTDAQMTRVAIDSVMEDPRPPVNKHDPNHPDADENGYVAFPNINLIEEMVNMMSAARSYEANVTAISTSKNMALKALEIGR